MTDATDAAILFGVIGFVVGIVAAMLAEGTVKEWLRTRHEYRMRLLAHREKWIEVDATRLRPGDYRYETKEGGK